MKLVLRQRLQPLIWGCIVHQPRHNKARASPWWSPASRGSIYSKIDRKTGHPAAIWTYGVHPNMLSPNQFWGSKNGSQLKNLGESPLSESRSVYKWWIQCHHLCLYLLISSCFGRLLGWVQVSAVFFQIPRGFFSGIPIHCKCTSHQPPTCGKLAGLLARWMACLLAPWLACSLVYCLACLLSCLLLGRLTCLLASWLSR